MKRFVLTLLAGYTCMSVLQAAPSDPFLSSSFSTDQQPRLHLTASFDAVNDTIDFADFRQSEGLSDSSTGDYQGFHLAANYQFHPQWSVDAEYWKRKIDFASDTNNIDSMLLAVRYKPELNLSKKSSLSLRAGIWGNQANELNKSTPTRINQRNYEQVQVSQPEDIQFQLDGIFSHKIDHMNQLNLFTGSGYSKVKVNRLDIQTQSRGCLMNIAIHSDNRYYGQLARPCQVDNMLMTKMNISGNATEYGIDIQKDLNYEAWFAHFGGSWSWRYRAFESQLAYQYQHLWRKDIDDRVSSFGSSPISNNHTFAAKMSYDFSPQLTGFFQGELYQHNFTGNIPFLYNGVTASRLDRRYGLASLGITFHGF